MRKKDGARRPTIVDVAAALRVSPTAVSRALRGLKGVSEPLRRKIARKARELRYIPNPAGAALSTGRTRSIIFLLPYSEFPSLLQMEILEGLIHDVSPRGYNVTIMSEQYLRKQRMLIFDALRATNADGCVCLFLRTKDPAIDIDRLGFPCVVINKVTGARNADFVVTDDEHGAYLATEHLIQAGHRAIAYLTGPSDNFNVRRRLAGYKSAMKEHGLKVRNELIEATGLNREGGRTAMSRLLDKRTDFTAVFCCVDIAALGALDALRTKGLRVPDDIALVGFDDDSFAAIIEPPLTTVRKPRYGMGQAAGRLLMERIEGSYKGATRTVSLRTELICRASSSTRARLRIA